uniref:Uncharacterized protein n=1 Tax=Mycobacterium riyadhense TaxID=486698 RepID=A0A653F4A3_9MYCO|nr:hypothetical protein BIN_B_05564 [Mycobacterium riyadhense]
MITGFWREYVVETAAGDSDGAPAAGMAAVQS